MCIYEHVSVFLGPLVKNVTPGSLVPNPILKASMRPLHGAKDSDMTTKTGIQPLPMPPALELPQVCGHGQTFSGFLPYDFDRGGKLCMSWLFSRLLSPGRFLFKKNIS